MVNVTTRVFVHLYIIGYWEDISREVQMFFFFFLRKGTEKCKSKRRKNEKREIKRNAI